MWFRVLLASLALCPPVLGSNTEGRIWFEGEKMPGRNGTIGSGLPAEGGWQGAGAWQRPETSTASDSRLSFGVQTTPVSRGEGYDNRPSNTYGNSGNSKPVVSQQGTDYSSWGFKPVAGQGSPSQGSSSNQGSSGSYQGPSSTGNQGSSSSYQGTTSGNQGSSGSYQGSSGNQGYAGSYQGSSLTGNQGSSGSYQGSSSGNQGSSGSYQGSSSGNQGSSGSYQGSSSGNQGSSGSYQGSSSTGNQGFPSGIYQGGNHSLVVPRPWRPWEELTRYERLLARGLVGLGLDLERAISHREGNKVFSPVSVASAMALVLLGSAGRTREELARALGLTPGIDLTDRVDILHHEFGKLFKKLEKRGGSIPGVELRFASGIFVQKDYPVRQRYTAMARDNYDSEVLQLDFLRQSNVAKETINKWVADRTEGRITDLISDSFSPDTRVVIANALYFNGEWEYPFVGSLTKARPFYVSNTEIVDVPMMVNTAEVYYSADKKHGFRVLGLPYKGGEMFLFLVLPEQDLKSFISTLTSHSLQDMVQQTSISQVIYTVPRMRLDSTLMLRGALEKLGVKTMFDPYQANLSGIASGLFASQVFHRVQIEVTETGTVAAAATAVTLTRDGSTPIVRFDRPFLFFMYHKKTEAITFWGTVQRPTPHTAHQSSSRHY